MANLFFIPAKNSLSLLYARAQHIFSIKSLMVFIPLYFVLVLWTAGLPVAAGLFIPMMLLGGSLGRLFGESFQLLAPKISWFPVDPSIYALVGSAAMMSGSSRLTISVCVIIMELTQSNIVHNYFFFFYLIFTLFFFGFFC
jgi:chloride channel 7